MQRILLTLALCFSLALPLVAEEFLLKDGTKIVGHMTAIKDDKIEVETAYGKMLLKRSDILTIRFPENDSSAASAPAPQEKELPKIDESLDGTQYLNKSSSFALTLPLEWTINSSLHRSPEVVAAFSSRDSMRYLMVVEEEYSGSLESYKGLVEIQAKNNLQEYEKLSEAPFTVDGRSSFLVSYRGVSTKANNLPIQFLVAIIPSGKDYFKITAWCVEPLFNETQPIFERIIRSYHRVAPGVTPTPAGKP